MSETIRVQVCVDTDELRHWADRHAVMGQAGVAHVLYEAAHRYEAGVDSTRDPLSQAKFALREFDMQNSPFLYAIGQALVAIADELHVSNLNDREDGRRG